MGGGKKKSAGRRRDGDAMGVTAETLRRMIPAIPGARTTTAEEGRKNKSRGGGTRRPSPTRAKTATATIGDRLPGPDASVEPVSEDDYYLKNREFSVWLKHERSVYFTDLLAADARAAFKDFVKAWNARALPATFYKEGGVSASGRR
jgi:hypothetical protein